MEPLREVIETVFYDDAVRVERLSCGHIKTTLTASDRPAKRRRCLKCGLGDSGRDRLAEFFDAS